MLYHVSIHQDIYRYRQSMVLTQTLENIEIGYFYHPASGNFIVLVQINETSLEQLESNNRRLNRMYA